MNIRELNKLANSKKFTNIQLYNYYKDNPDILETIPANSVISEPALCEAVKINGLSMLPDCNMDLNVFLEMVKTGGNVVLSGNIILDNYIEVTNDLTIDLNGYSIIYPATSSAKYQDVFEVMTGGKLTINGDGEVIAENGYSVYAAGDSVVTLNDGYYFSPVSVVDARKHASVTINGGVYKVDGSNNPDGDFGQKYTLNLRDKTGNYVGDLSEIVVKGGRFYKYNPAMSESEPELTNFVASGYESLQKGDWYEVEEIGIVVDDITE